MNSTTSEQFHLYNINEDVLTVVNIATELNWVPIREQSISRILYLASVLYSFRFRNQDNPFVKDYHFSVDASGPFYSLIKNSLIFLEANDYIKRESKNEISLGINNTINLNKLPNHETKAKWLRSIFYIIGVYGESKIYEFIIRDPQYQQNLNSNTLKDINIGPNNETVATLSTFKEAFEEELKEEAEQIDDKEYLELYFEYLFSKIIKGDVQL